MTVKELDADTIRSILKQHSPGTTAVYRTPDPTCTCGTKLVNGYCVNSSCPRDVPIITLECNYCGYCERPGNCVTSVACPTCGSEPSNLCLDARGGLTGYHEERWNVVKERYGNYYR